MNQESQEDYKTLVLLLGLLGYAYILGILAILGIVLVTLIHKAVTDPYDRATPFKIALGVAALTAIILRALWVKLDPPQGVPLKASQRVPLLDLIEDIRRETGAPFIHEVLITAEIKTGIQQLPRWGFFGPCRNYLTIGLPLLMAVPTAEFTAILAHTYGHLARTHNRWDAWLYRLRHTWRQLMEAFDRDRRWGGILFRPFFHWYAPFFERYAFVFAREQEFEADRMAVYISGSRVAAEALIRTALTTRRLAESFWPQIKALADREPEPPNPYEHLPHFLHTTIDETTAQRWLQEALPSRGTDTYPGLRARLKAMKEQPHLPEPLEEGTAAEELVGRLRPSCTMQIGAAWQHAVAEEWIDRHALAQKEHQD